MWTIKVNIKHQVDGTKPKQRCYQVDMADLEIIQHGLPGAIQLVGKTITHNWGK